MMTGWFTILVALVTLGSVSAISLFFIVTSIIHQVIHHVVLTQVVGGSSGHITLPVSATVEWVRPVSGTSLVAVNPLVRGSAVLG